MNTERERLRGTISLYFDEEIITVERFAYAAFKTTIINKWERLYQLSKKRNGEVSFRVLYD